MHILGNIIWIVFGGFFIAVEYFISGVALCLSIIGIPFGLQIIKLSLVALWPFGTTVDESYSSNNTLSLIMNIIWLILGGIWIALSHLIFALFFAITIIGLPFALQHVKLAKLAVFPFGKSIA